MLFICWCCHQRNNTTHLSSCSSTSTPIKKSSHMINTVTSSPFHSSIIPINKQFQRHLYSSSSSTNTNIQNQYHRQTLLKPEIKRQNILMQIIHLMKFYIQIFDFYKKLVKVNLLFHLFCFFLNPSFFSSR